MKKVIIPSQDLIDDRRKLIIPMKGMTVKLLMFPTMLIIGLMLGLFGVLDILNLINIYTIITLLLLGSILIIIISGTPGGGKRTVLGKIKKIKEFNKTKKNKIYKKSKKYYGE